MNISLMNEQPKKRSALKYFLIATTFALVGVLALSTLSF
jgi:hypothetical protein